MWGSAFSDLAKKAHELQEQAEAVANTSSWSTPSSLFNLDAMQEKEGESSKRPKHEKVPPVEMMTASKPQQRLNVNSIRTEPVVTTSPVRGKLKVPEKAKPKTPVKEATAASTIKMAPPKAPILAEENNVVVEEGNGWDEEDIAFGDSQEENGIAATTDKIEPEVEDTVPNAAAGTGSTEGAEDIQRVHATEIAKETIPSDIKLNGGHVPETETIADLSGTKTGVQLKQVEETSKSESFGKSSQDTSGQVDDNSSVAKNFERETMQAVDMVEDEPTKELDEADMEDVEAETLTLEGRKGEQKPDAATSVPDECSRSEATTGEAIKKKVLVLSSNHSLNRNAHKRQQFIYTVLDSKGINFETIDGADPLQKEWRDQLFELSGIREYPQVFLLDMSDGKTSFWGSYDNFQHANDDGTLVNELTGAVTSTSHLGDLKRTDTQRDEEVETNVAESANSDALSKIEVPDVMMEQFSHQLKRLEENYQAEKSDMEQRHAQEMQKALDSLNHDVCESQRRELEERMSSKIQEKEEQLLELMQANEGYKLKLDVLKREVEGTQRLLEARNEDMGKVNEVHSQDLKALEQKLLNTEAQASKYKLEIQQLTDVLDQSRRDLSANKQEHADLKARVKIVATELKDRRVECRELRAKVDELTESNERLQGEVEQLNLQLFSQDRSRSAKDEEMEQLRAELVDAAAAVERAEKAAREKEAQGEKALAEYKKKAQNSLSLANARTAAAVQAKEEAELEARAARSTADSAMERAVKAEMASKQAVAEAKVYVQKMEKEQQQSKGALATAKEELRVAQEQLSEGAEQLQDTIRSKDKLAEDLKGALTTLEAEREKASTYHEDLRQSQSRTNELRDDIATLREQLKRTEEAATCARTEATDDETKTKAAVTEPSSSKDHASSEDAAVMSLRQELQDANEAIEELKEALKNAVESNDSSNDVGSMKKYAVGSSGPQDEPSTNGGSDSTPLFFALEKQAELKTARNEINRLANLLADVQSEKMDALESMHEMRKRMEEAESRLKRFEKLGSVSTSRQKENGLVSPIGSHVDGHQSPPANSSNVNIEYLKNIMMRYLNAKTLAERKALMPVIGAVLCLTDDEQKDAMQSLEESSSLSQSLFESLSGKLTPR